MATIRNKSHISLFNRTKHDSMIIESSKEQILDHLANSLDLIKNDDGTYRNLKGEFFRRTHLGYEPINKQSLKVELYLLKRKINQLENSVKYYQDEVRHLHEKRENVIRHINKRDEQVRTFNLEKGKLKSLLKLALDRNISFEKKLNRVSNLNENLQNQNQKLQKTKDALLKANEELIEKSKKLRAQLKDCQ
ncbi:hypothetical protein EYV94_01675 [Puteibacter caeruleilacunae]|nr:hypothetical protein EYV94_01675 [Puteibacter caeruleilacunae]